MSLRAFCFWASRISRSHKIKCRVLQSAEHGFFGSVYIINFAVAFPFRLRLRFTGNQSRTFRSGHHGESVVEKIADVAKVVRVIFILSVISVLFVLFQKITSRQDFESRKKIGLRLRFYFSRKKTKKHGKCCLFQNFVGKISKLFERFFVRKIAC